MNNTTCYYCDLNESTSTKYSQPICTDCDAQKFSAIQLPKHRTEEQEAFRLKLLISMFKVAFEEA